MARNRTVQLGAEFIDHLPAEKLALWCVGDAEEKLSSATCEPDRTKWQIICGTWVYSGVIGSYYYFPNVRQLFEAMLALMKLGAVFTPCSTLLTETDLERTRVRRGRVRHVIVHAPLVEKFAHLPGDYTRIAGGAPGYHRFECPSSAVATFLPDSETTAIDPLVMYFTSGTTAKPKLVLHSHGSYPVGQLSTMYLVGLQPDDVLGIASPGWAAHLYIHSLPAGMLGRQLSRSGSPDLM